MPIVEVACVKDYPGAWAEYRIHEGGYTQLVRRIATPDAFAWTEQTREHVRRPVSRLRVGRAERSLLHAEMVDVQALEGLRVIDMATVFAGPGAARHLADFGADVVKVESPSGDGVRRMGWFPPEGGDSYTWKLLGRNKRTRRARSQDRRRPRRACCASPTTADVLVENFRPGTLERLGLGPDVLLARNPRLVVLRVTGFGQDGPYAAQAGLRDDRGGDERLRGDQRRTRRRRRCCRRSRSPTRSPRSPARSR